MNQTQYTIGELNRQMNVGKLLDQCGVLQQLIV